MPQDQFDTWLKGANTGMATTRTPLHYYDLGTNSFVQTFRWMRSPARTLEELGARWGDVFTLRR